VLSLHHPLGAHPRVRAARAPGGAHRAQRLLEVLVEASLEGSGTRANVLAKKANGLLVERRSAEAAEVYKQAWALNPSYDIAG
jgi:hypothetical protein